MLKCQNLYHMASFHVYIAKTSKHLFWQDEEDEDEEEEGGGLSKSGKELKKLLGWTSGLNESDAEDYNDDDYDVSFCDV